MEISEQKIIDIIKRAMQHNHNGINSPKIKREDLEVEKIHTTPPNASMKAQEGTKYLYGSGSYIYIYYMFNGVWRRHY